MSAFITPLFSVTQHYTQPFILSQCRLVLRSPLRHQLPYYYIYNDTSLRSAYYSQPKLKSSRHMKSHKVIVFYSLPLLSLHLSGYSTLIQPSLVLLLPVPTSITIQIAHIDSSVFIFMLLTSHFISQSPNNHHSTLYFPSPVHVSVPSSPSARPSSYNCHYSITLSLLSCQ